MFTALYFHTVQLHGRLAVLRRPFAEQAGAAGHNAGTNAIALVTWMVRSPAMLTTPSRGAPPAADGGVVLIVAHMSPSALRMPQPSFVSGKFVPPCQA